MRIPKYLSLYIIIGMLLLALFHFESLTITGEFKISHLWKGIALLYVSLKVYINKETDKFFYKPMIFLAALQLLSPDLINAPFSAILNLLITLFIPLMGIFILRFNYDQLKRIILFLSIFIILSFLPYYFGIFKSITSGYDLEAFGGNTGLIGPFQKPHSASIALASSLIIILFFLFEGSFKKKYLLILFCLGIYFLFLTYVRTGLAMFFAGTISILLFFMRKTTKALLIIFSIGIIFIWLNLLYINSNPVLKNRIIGQTAYNSEDNIEKVGSGRIMFWETSINIFKDENIIEKLFGIGEYEEMDRMYQNIGMRIFAHNGFLHILLANGMLGLILFLTYLYKVYKFSNSYKSEAAILVRSILFSYIIMCFVQSYDYLITNLLLMISIGMKYSYDMKLEECEDTIITYKVS